MNKKWIIIFVIIFAACLAFVIFFQSNSNSAQAHENIDLNEYQEKINKKQNFIIYIYSPTCATCEEFAPTLNATIQDTKTKVYSLNVSEINNNKKVFLEKQSIEVTPSLIKYKNGKEQDRRIGNIPEKELKEFLKK
ncbi:MULTISPECIES: thioredoxin family protein [Bacillota]|uniref:Disulfide bond formation protein n=3 Tax=Bacillota TaxID=1239 RepID=A0A8B5YFI9_BACLI|nr:MULTISPECIES: thioredoxin family protein [Bacillota]MBD8048766.1 thioredoxin family protein [Clostridium faecium]MBU8803162.1 thioredoxin family protein [Bacillus licheniformis]MBY8833052.1 thioredoxin family protein [Bacillus licheniformis]MDE1390092.1 thioredoxin family protein [Bacillus licheniformis]TWL31009.1 Disulfide bond formation protein [Bacillus licheniformis]